GREQDLAQEEEAGSESEKANDCRGAEELAGRDRALGLREDALEEPERRRPTRAEMHWLPARPGEDEVRVTRGDRRLDEAAEAPRDAALGVDQWEPETEHDAHHRRGPQNAHDDRLREH